jgi:hypothetical protein
MLRKKLLRMFTARSAGAVVAPCQIDSHHPSPEVVNRMIVVAKKIKVLGCLNTKR